jgi:hypothetical protein
MTDPDPFAAMYRCYGRAELELDRSGVCTDCLLTANDEEIAK